MLALYSMPEAVRMFEVPSAGVMTLGISRWIGVPVAVGATGSLAEACVFFFPSRTSTYCDSIVLPPSNPKYLP